MQFIAHIDYKGYPSYNYISNIIDTSIIIDISIMNDISTIIDISIIIDIYNN